MKKIITMSLAMIVLMSFLSAPAFAGATQRHRWQGIAIGIGAVLLGQALLNNSRDYSQPERVVAQRPPVYYRYSAPPAYNRGYWKIRKVWVPPVRERVWNPAHYDDYDEWVPGRWIMIQKSPGHWRQERVWISN